MYAHAIARSPMAGVDESAVRCWPRLRKARAVRPFHPGLKLSGEGFSKSSAARKFAGTLAGVQDDEGANRGYRSLTRSTPG